MDYDSPSDASSDLSSLRSPTPPLDYPTPPSTQDSTLPYLQDGSASASGKRAFEQGGEPQPKKRRRTEPKPRTTEKLDLRAPNAVYTRETSPGLDRLLKVLQKRRKIVVIVGAGISVSAGIPDFRSSTGLFNSLKTQHKLKASGKQLFDASVYQTDASTSSFHDMVRSLSDLVNKAKPTAFHQMLSTLASEGRLMRLYTQNVDGIDVSLPSLETRVPLGSKGPWPRAVQLHGGLEKMVCSKCGHLSGFNPTLFDGPAAPLCNVCVERDELRTNHAGKRSHGIGRLRPRMVLYNEHNPDEEAIGAVMTADLRSRPDAVIVVGTSMKIPGVRRIVKEMCGVVRGRRDGLAVWVNHDGPPPGKDFEDCWDLIVRGPCDQVAKAFNDHNHEWSECTESEVERAKIRTGELQVQMYPSSQETIESHAEKGLLTPGMSPNPKPAIKAEAALGDYPLFAVESIPRIDYKISTTTSSRIPKKKATGPKKPKNPKVPQDIQPPGEVKLKLKLKPPVQPTINATFRVSKPKLTSTNPDRKALSKRPKSPSTKSEKQQPSQSRPKSRPSPIKPLPLASTCNQIPTRTTPLSPSDSTPSSGLSSPLDLSSPLLTSPFLPFHTRDSFERDRSSPNDFGRTPSPIVRYDRRHSNEIISPTGSIPKDMMRLLN
ncbi:hypothetical protein MMC25_006554 [Agyrium rufum]|nr:hypothetical protein [Agyrium rufum]